MTKLITGKAITAHCRKVCSAKGDSVLAVSYWGRGAAEALGIKAGSEVRVVLNVEHGGTNPSELEDLMEIMPGRVMVHRKLHAKIYASQKRAVVGSANASSAGLNWGGRGHSEAAVKLKGSAAGDALRLAAEFYEAGEPATQDHVATCRERFGNRSLASAVEAAGKPVGEKGKEDPFETFLQRSDIFGKLPVIITDGKVDPVDAKEDFARQRVASEEMGDDAEYDPKVWSYFKWPLDQRYRGHACVEFFRSDSGEMSMHLVQPIYHFGDVGTFARRLAWPVAGDLGPNWRQMSRSLPADERLLAAYEAVYQETYITCWDIYDRVAEKS